MVRAGVLALALVACGRIDFGEVPLVHDDALAGDAADLQPIHQYSLNNSYADDFGGPSLTGHGGMFGSDGYDFAANQGLSVDGALPQDVFTIDVEFAFADLSGWRKIIDFENLTLDSGFYTFDSALQYVIVPEADFLTGLPTLVASTQIRVTLTRDAAMQVVAYLDGALVMAARTTNPTPPATLPSTPFAFGDASRVAALTGNTLTLFIDDAITSGGESAAGFVRRIRIYDVALTAAQVAATP